jgi:shikimate dehydrogenase
VARTVTYPTICGSISGKPSPLGVAIHNSGYEALDIDFRYVALGTQDLTQTIAAIRSLCFRGCGISMPHKISVVELLDEVTPDVSLIGACNTVVNCDGRLIGHNTDWKGALDALAEVGIDNPKTAVIVGSGGAARAIAYGLNSKGCQVTISARNLHTASKLVADLGLVGVVSLQEQDSVDADLIVNATPVSDQSCPLVISRHKNAVALLDVAFTPRDTAICANASAAGLKVAAGWRMLLHQALHQFRLYTGMEPPKEVMSSVLSKALE